MIQGLTDRTVDLARQIAEWSRAAAGGATGRILVDGTGSLLHLQHDADADELVGRSFLGVGVDSRDPAVEAGNGAPSRFIVGAGGTIEGNGLSAGSSTANETIVQNRGTVAPGLSAGTLFFDGDFILDGGTLLLEAFGASEFDQLTIAGDLVLLGGAIEILLGFTPDPFEPLQLINVEDIVFERGGLDPFMVRALAGSGRLHGRRQVLSGDGRDPSGRDGRGHHPVRPGAIGLPERRPAAGRRGGDRRDRGRDHPRCPPGAGGRTGSPAR